MEQYLRAALDNIARYGDTDVFPFPIENHIFFDKPTEALELLKQVHADFDDALVDTPPINQSMLSAVGYTGFRLATQVDPVWNAYLLACVIAIGDDIEARRIAIDRSVIFSYRFSWDKELKSIFRRDVGWPEFQEESAARGKAHAHVLLCDIADFYPRIYHHRLENALKRCTQNTEVVRRVMALLSRFSGGPSYGIPVGGPASRLLSELLLNRVDRLLQTSGITFCRFADDYRIFCTSAEQAYSHLVFLSEKLHENEGLLIQKHKTRVLSAEEFLGSSELFPDDANAEQRETSLFMRLRLHYDPYSSTAKIDYAHLTSELAKFDVVGMLAREMAKSRAHLALARRLVSAVRHLDKATIRAAILSMIENLQVLYPVFPTVAIVIRECIDRLDAPTLEAVFGRLRELVRLNSYMVMVPANLAYTVRLLAYDRSEETDALLDRLYRDSRNVVIRRDVILAMARREADYWISDVKNSFSTQSPWEKIATIVGSYILGDEGSHWRRAISDQVTPLQELAIKWAGDRKGRHSWDVPL
jgi:hypothetical protein